MTLPYSTKTKPAMKTGFGIGNSLQAADSINTLSTQFTNQSSLYRQPDTLMRLFGPKSASRQETIFRVPAKDGSTPRTDRQASGTMWTGEPSTSVGHTMMERAVEPSNLQKEWTMSRTKKIVRFVASLVSLPVMVFPMTITACMEWLSEKPDWGYFKSYYRGYIDMITFKQRSE
jgi:hypothetical protein